MNLERYEYLRARTHKEYDFYSKGPKGIFKKVVRFVLLPCGTTGLYNLLMGDWDEERQEINIESITNNGDAEKVLATVAAIIIDFTSIYNNAIIYATGSTVTRTRRYQMGINKFWSEIDEMFYVDGFIDGELEPFQKNVNYEGFLISRKESIILKEQTESYMTASSSSNNSNNNSRVYNDQTVDNLVDISNTVFYAQKMAAAQKQLEKIILSGKLINRYRQ